MSENPTGPIGGYAATADWGTEKNRVRLTMRDNIVTLWARVVNGAWFVVIRRRFDTPAEADHFYFLLLGARI